ncbi:unnamed protein product [Ambrosiozyma monospora]|uniref:Unnamed protein product n=1 Tax=Ambrosiozyma monospora TaxID=43982 RepID=A0ACB5UAS8_AMBMO|nr:unnamed protein product [Ambrosiozyma monospora]
MSTQHFENCKFMKAKHQPQVEKNASQPNTPQVQEQQTQAQQLDHLTNFNNPTENSLSNNQRQQDSIPTNRIDSETSKNCRYYNLPVSSLFQLSKPPIILTMNDSPTSNYMII